jgi:hypothetical protein
MSKKIIYVKLFFSIFPLLAFKAILISGVLKWGRDVMGVHNGIVRSCN